MTLPDKTEQQLEPTVQSWFTNAHKAAIILASLSAESASAIVEEISDAHLRAFAKAFSELKSVPPQLLHAIAKEFVAEVQHVGGELAGGIEEARNVLGQLAEEERVNRILSELAGGGEQSVWVRVENVEDQTLCDYIEAQRLPVAAAILSKLSYEKTANLLALAQAEFSKNVLLELSRRNPPTGEVLEAIALAIEEELLTPLAAKPATGDAGAIVGEIINCLPGPTRDTFLNHMIEADPEIGAEVRKAVLTFEELHLRLPESAVPMLLKEIDRDTLLAALKYGESNASDTVAFVLGNISKRMAEQYREDLVDLGEVGEVEGENAQRYVTSNVRRLTKEGEIKLLALKETSPNNEKNYSE